MPEKKRTHLLYHPHDLKHAMENSGEHRITHHHYHKPLKHFTNKEAKPVEDEIKETGLLLAISIWAIFILLILFLFVFFAKYG